MDKSSIEKIHARNTFYKSNFYLLLLANLLLIVVIGLLLAYLWYQSSTRPTAKYFAATPDARIIIDPPVDINHLKLSEQQYLDNGYIIGSDELYVQDLKYAKDDPDNAIIYHWTEKAIRKIYDYDYINYARALQDIRDYFTNNGYQQYILTLHKSLNLKAVKRNKWIVSAIIPGHSKIIDESYIKGYKTWKFEIPVNVKYDDTVEKPRIEELKAEVSVARVSTLKSPFYGLSIYRVIFGTRIS